MIGHLINAQPVQRHNIFKYAQGCNLVGGGGGGGGGGWGGGGGGGGGVLCMASQTVYVSAM